ncbi:MAG TPA: glycosyltransferase family 4 protein [Candidatus Fermentibacter sp.]|nr:glycosyltransferase family 4 protein [Candidatus Fermentibacter sp.]
MKVLVLNWRDPRNPEAGGAEVHLHEIMRRAASAGHEIVQVSQACDGLPGEETIDGVGIIRRGGRFTFNLGLRGWCRRHLDLASFDLVVEDLCKLPFFSPSWSPAPVLVLVPHLFGTTAYREVAFPLALYVDALERLIPRVYRGCRFVAISESTKRDLERRGIPGGDISVSPCGIDLDEYAPSPSGAHDPRTILYVGRLKRYKGVQTLIEALSILRDRGSDAVLRVVGTGDFREELERLADRLGLQDRVVFTGFVPGESKLAELRNACVAALPSEKEGWGLTVIEANACGTPVVASDSDGLRDSVRNGETGILVPHGDPEALAGALSAVLSDPGLRARLSEAGKVWAGRFGWDVTAGEVIGEMIRAAGAGVQR